MEQFDIDQLKEIAQNLGPLHYAIIGGVLLLFIILIVVSSIRARKKRKARQVAPDLTFHSLQVAPLGKGVQIKILNKGHQATVTDIYIKKRHDLNITQGYKDYLIETGKFYNVFCEAKGSGRADDGFELWLHFKDVIGNTYKQAFHIAKSHSKDERARVSQYA